MSAPRIESASQVAPWASLHAFGMIASIAWAAVSRVEWVLALACAVSFPVFVARSRAAWTPDGRFGVPNAITTLRLLMALALLVVHAALPAPVVAGAAFAILLLDALDGWVARRAGNASEFGARYDVEVDSAFTSALALLLWVRAVGGPWVLIAGLWRYLYVATTVIFPTTTSEVQRSRFGRYVYILMISSFALAFALPPDLGAAAAAIGTIAVSTSFAVSFWQRYAPASTTPARDRR